MHLVSLIVLLVVAAVCGGIGRAIAGGTNGGCLVSIAVGFIGAIVGRWLAGLTSLPEPLMLHVAHERIPVVWTIVGATVFVAVVHLVSGGRRRRRG